MTPPEPSTPWAGWLRHALALGLTPVSFWALSLKEWRHLALPHPNDTLTPQDFAALAARYPDDPK